MTSNGSTAKSRSKSPKSEQYLYRAKGSKVSKKTISEAWPVIRAGTWMEGVRRSDMSLADKKVSLLTMTVEEKRHKTCLDMTTGFCTRLDAGKLLFVGSKKKHICSKIMKDSVGWFQGVQYVNL